MKISLPASLGLCLELAIIASVQAQGASPQLLQPIKETPAESKIADLSIEANVTASALKFTQTGHYKVEFQGFPERKTLWEENRQNWPKNPQSGVTYNNVGLQIRVTSRFSEIEKIVNDFIDGNSAVTSSIKNSAGASGISNPIAPLAPKPVIAPEPVKPLGTAR